GGQGRSGAVRLGRVADTEPRRRRPDDARDADQEHLRGGGPASPMSQIPLEAIRLMNGFRGYQLVAAACRLKLPDLVAAGHTDPDELSSLTGMETGSLRRVLRGLAAW